MCYDLNLINFYSRLRKISIVGQYMSHQHIHTLARQIFYNIFYHESDSFARSYEICVSHRRLLPEHLPFLI